MFTIEGIIPSMLHKLETRTDTSVVSWWVHNTTSAPDDGKGSRTTRRGGGQKADEGLGVQTGSHGV